MTKDLFTFQGDQNLLRNAPLAERMRPQTIEEFVGQTAIISEGRLLRRAIKADRIGNIILFGPPGVGKTTLARIIAANSRSRFTSLNAVLAGVKDLRNEVDAARKRIDQHGLRTILFIDEVHRFNTAQQDALLPWVENGTLILIGATTENPYFEVNKALVSRSRIFRLEALTDLDLHTLLQRALKDEDRGYGKLKIKIEDDAANHLVNISNGDARSLLNALELAVGSSAKNDIEEINIDLTVAEDSIQQRAVLYDKHGDAHFDTISAFIKSLRGSDPDAALFWLARMLEAGENPRFIFRRMIIAACEDIGLADPQAIVVVQSCSEAFERVGLPEGVYLLSEAALYLASAEKSNSISGFFLAQKTVRQSQGQAVPNHLRDAHRDGNALGDGKNYKYPHSVPEHWVVQQYLPKSLEKEVFWVPGSSGWEGERRSKILLRRAAQLASSIPSNEGNPYQVSFGPDSPDLELWLQNQFAQTEVRLHNLLAKLWHDFIWGRTDRVLVLGSGSLFWALTPLGEVPEGGVSILISSKSEQQNLSPQLERLDPLERPTLIHASLEAFEGLSPDFSFEVVGGRLSSQDLAEKRLLDLWSSISKKCSSKSKLRLLISHSVFGPAKSLKQILDFPNKYLDQLINSEEKLLSSLDKEKDLIEVLNSIGWKIKIEESEEYLKLTIDEELERRWFSKDQAYYKLILKNFDKKVFDDMKNIFHKLQGKCLPQKLIHHRLIGCLD